MLKRISEVIVERDQNTRIVSTGMSATEQIFAKLYQAVISLELPPGSKVSEVEIARQLDVSRQPVRDVFYRLSKLGFLLIRPQRATLVTRISERSVQKAIFVRTALEVECLRTAAADQREQLIDRWQQLLADQQGQLNDATEFHLLDEEFHRVLCDCAGQPEVWALIQEQKAHLDRIRYMTLSLERRHIVVEEHSELIDNLREGDIATAEEKLRAHLKGIERNLDKVRSHYAHYFEESE